MDLTADQLGTLITLGAAAAGSLLVIIVNCLTSSRCTDISCCWNCFHCIRKLPEPENEETEGDIEQEAESADPQLVP
jgi:hypothetical protein